MGQSLLVVRCGFAQRVVCPSAFECTARRGVHPRRLRHRGLLAIVLGAPLCISGRFSGSGSSGIHQLYGQHRRIRRSENHRRAQPAHRLFRRRVRLHDRVLDNRVRARAAMSATARDDMSGSSSVTGIRVIGVNVDDETRCAHYAGASDIIAIKFKCCGKWFPCHKCHEELAGHAAEVWPKEQFKTPAVLCGGCSRRLTIRQYLDCDSMCPLCGRQFNPGCARHYDLYFDVSF